MTASPLIIFVLHCVKIFISIWHLLILLFMLAWDFGFRMWRLTQATGVLFLVSAEYCAVMCGAFPGTRITWQLLSLSRIYCCALRPWSRTGLIYPSFWFLYLVVLSCAWCRDIMPRASGMTAYVRDGYGAFCQPKFECCKMLLFRV